MPVIVAVQNARCHWPLMLVAYVTVNKTNLAALL